MIHLTPQPGPAPSAPVPRYTATAQALHWLTALLVLAVVPLAWVGNSLPEDAAAVEPLFTLHESIGLTILAVVVVRILWRAVHPAPSDAGIPRTLAVLGRINQWLLYALFLVMPVSGYLLSAADGNVTQYFFLFPVPGMAKNQALADAADQVHLAGQYAVYALVALHVLATIWHVAIRRDGLLDRMLPQQDV